MLSLENKKIACQQNTKLPWKEIKKCTDCKSAPSDFSSLTVQKKRSKIGAVYLKDINYKNRILGVIIGHFTMTEFQYYCLNSSELNKRILKIVAQRVQDSFVEDL